MLQRERERWGALFKNKPQLGKKERIPALKYKSPMQILPMHFYFKNIKDVKEFVPAYGPKVVQQFEDEKTRVKFIGLYSHPAHNR